MKPCISADEIERLDRDHLEGGHLIALVHVPFVRLSPVRGPVADGHGRARVLEDLCPTQSAA